MNRLAHEFGDRLSCSVFGCSDDELVSHSLRPKDVENHGVLPRERDGALFRGTDLFLDLSDYQAFERTAIEAMSCGIIPVVPVHGGTSEFARDGINAFVVNTRDNDAVLAALAGSLGLTGGEHGDMRLAGITAGFRHSPETAALSEIKLLASHLLQR